MRVRAVVTDLDGTLLPSGGTISARSLAALRRLGAEGCLRVIATGRNLYSALQVLPDDFPIDYLVFSSGAGVMRWRDRRLLCTIHLEEGSVREIARFLWDANLNFTVQREMPDNHLFYYTSFYPEPEDFLRRVRFYSPFGTFAGTVDAIRGKATQFLVILDAVQLRLFESLRRELAAYSVVRSTSPVDGRALWLEVFAKGVNMGSTCRRLLEGVGIDMGDCAGLGNDYNDTDFLELCGEAFVVANAPSPLKARYRMVAGVCEDGFVEFVEKVCRWTVLFE